MKDRKHPADDRPEPSKEEREALRQAKKQRLACEARNFAFALGAMLLILMMILAMTLPKLAAPMPPP